MEGRVPLTRLVPRSPGGVDKCEDTPQIYKPTLQEKILNIQNLPRIHFLKKKYKNIIRLTRINVH